MERKVILYIAMSIDGYIARLNGDIDWLSIVEKPPEDYGYAQFIENIDTVIMGRKTYDKVRSFNMEFPHRGRKCYVISKMRTGIDEDIEYSDDLEMLIRDLKNTKGKNIFVDGGAEIVNELLKIEMIDELIISILPILLGSGIRLFQDRRSEQKVILKKTVQFETGLVQLWYCFEKL
ncbi:MAG: dihydrofolate reductase [Pelosinus sp.]|jgi:dihydrofolate reductase|nr:dihydrofolate reductase [Pelosinus sp.]